MQRRITAVLAWLLLVLSSHFTIAAEASPKDVGLALASAEPVVLIGVPAAFLHPETVDSEEAEAQSDWAYYLNEWIRNSAKKRKLKIIAVPLDVLAEALQTPALKGNGCATLFVKNRTEGLLRNNDCVPQIKDYEIGTKWLQGTASRREIAQSGFKTTAVFARIRK